MGYTRKLIKKSKTIENFLQKIMFRNKCLKNRIIQVQRKANKKTQETSYLHKKSIPQKNYPEDRITENTQEKY